eukprot:409184-Rhodomonas_salina.3
MSARTLRESGSGARTSKSDSPRLHSQSCSNSVSTLFCSRLGSLRILRYDVRRATALLYAACRLGASCSRHAPPQYHFRTTPARYLHTIPHLTTSTPRPLPTASTSTLDLRSLPPHPYLYFHSYASAPLSTFSVEATRSHIRSRTFPAMNLREGT